MLFFDFDISLKSLATLSLFFLFCLASSFRWTKDGEQFDPGSDPELKVTEHTGSFAFYTLSNTMDTLKQYQGKYVCYASNELGTAVSNEATLTTDGNNILIIILKQPLISYWNRVIIRWKVGNSHLNSVMLTEYLLIWFQPWERNHSLPEKIKQIKNPLICFQTNYSTLEKLHIFYRWQFQCQRCRKCLQGPDYRSELCVVIFINNNTAI